MSGPQIVLPEGWTAEADIYIKNPQGERMFVKTTIAGAMSLVLGGPLLGDDEGEGGGGGGLPEGPYMVAWSGDQPTLALDSPVTVDQEFIGWFGIVDLPQRTSFGMRFNGGPTGFSVTRVPAEAPTEQGKLVLVFANASGPGEGSGWEVDLPQQAYARIGVAVLRVGDGLALRFRDSYTGTMSDEIVSPSLGLTEVTEVLAVSPLGASNSDFIVEQQWLTGVLSAGSWEPYTVVEGSSSPAVHLSNASISPHYLAVPWYTGTPTELTVNGGVWVAGADMRGWGMVVDLTGISANGSMEVIATGVSGSNPVKLVITKSFGELSGEIRYLDGEVEVGSGPLGAFPSTPTANMVFLLIKDAWGYSFHYGILESGNVSWYGGWTMSGLHVPTIPDIVAVEVTGAYGGDPGMTQFWLEKSPLSPLRPPFSNPLGFVQLPTL